MSGAGASRSPGRRSPVTRYQVCDSPNAIVPSRTSTRATLRTSRLRRVKVGVVGLGTMGAGIAQLAVEAGLETVGREVIDELGEKARGRIERSEERRVGK